MINTVSTPYLLHLLFVPAIIIILLTLLDKHNEDAKWFMFNTALINIVTGIAWEMKRMPRSFGQWNSYINMVWFIGRDLSQYSIFLLAITRVFVLYWPNVYKIAFARKFFFFWIIASDALLAGLSHFSHKSGQDMYELYTAIEVFMLLGTFGCSLFVLLRIHKMKKFAQNSTQSDTFNNLRRASFVCLFQSFFYTIYTMLLIYMRLYDMKIITREPSSPVVLRILLAVLSELQNPMFLLFTILDTLIPMFLLRSYRRTIKRLCSKPYRLIVGQKSSVVTVSTYTTVKVVPKGQVGVTKSS
ncbi:hypothetical protein DdX_17588 [Ditylenchus destructor]|uniref:Uncharacterized protein n=1 Tax=Ditylenchus destructor TaxID=166010 RepID=A0AAD4MNT4_9BILA|nr:hypothetical protein DdX_17588 [Ditylenchus destructor]